MRLVSHIETINFLDFGPIQLACLIICTYNYIKLVDPVRLLFFMCTYNYIKLVLFCLSNACNGWYGLVPTIILIYC